METKRVCPHPATAKRETWIILFHQHDRRTITEKYLDREVILPGVAFKDEEVTCRFAKQKFFV
jgi:hypothetical protein